MERAVVLLSGGLDSATALACAAKRDHMAAFCLTIDYGQVHAVEIDAARKVAASLDSVEHKVIRLNLAEFGGSALTGDGEVPKDRPENDGDIPPTYVPARNLVFLSLALSWAEVLGAEYIYTGVNAVDYSGYPDCRPAFVRSFEETANLATAAGTKRGVRFHVRAPLLAMSKAEIIRLGTRLGVDYSLTHSCYDPAPNGAACGRCDSCILRRRGFREAGIDDPAVYDGPG